MHTKAFSRGLYSDRTVGFWPHASLGLSRDHIEVDADTLGGFFAPRSLREQLAKNSKYVT